VKQLKEVLVLNRVDFKGCCEKKELKERVHRLWKSHVTATRKSIPLEVQPKQLSLLPASEKLPTDDLCKICMDAPIECVFLECGHSCTCVNCGKVSDNQMAKHLLTQQIVSGSQRMPAVPVVCRSSRQNIQVVDDERCNCRI
jgi:hypothetical protein